MPRGKEYKHKSKCPKCDRYVHSNEEDEYRIYYECQKCVPAYTFSLVKTRPKKT